MNDVAHRFVAVDRLRGLIMVIMALDHASFFLNKVHPSEFWGIALPDYPGAMEFATRFITHLCAPGFFLTMGIGMAFWFERHAKSLAPSATIRHFGIRALLILLVHQLLENPAWVLGILTATTPIDTFSSGVMPGGGEEPVALFGVLYSLAVSMFVWAFLLRLQTPIVLLISAAALLVSQYGIPATSQAQEYFGILQRMILIPGQSGRVVVTYPVLPWLGICGLGIVLGRNMAANRSNNAGVLLLSGMAFVVTFVVARLSGFWSHHPFEAGSGWLGFFNLTKYPPSINFLLLMVGMNLILAYALRGGRNAGGSANGVLSVFGRTPLFFYLSHLWILSAMGLLFRAGSNYWITYFGWLVVVVSLYPLCRRYAGFRGRQKDSSLWRAL